MNCKMYDIIFVGNSSIDQLLSIKKSGKYIGGGAIYSSFASKFCDKNLKIAVLSSIGSDIKPTVFSKVNIDFIGKVNDGKSNTFIIDEINDTCFNPYKNYLITTSPKKKYETKWLHVSFRKGIDINSILDDSCIHYSTLSVDVTHFSLQYTIPLLRKHKKQIKYIFCNMKEYLILKKNKIDCPQMIITNEGKNINYINNSILSQIHLIQKPKGDILSTTGLGDTFIGGVISKLVKGKNIYDSIYTGAALSFIALNFIGATCTNKYSYKDFLIQIDKIKKINSFPQLIIVIGNSCSGKSTFVEFLNKVTSNAYNNYDDFQALNEVFNMDTLLWNNNIDGFNKYTNQIKFSHNIKKEYINNHFKREFLYTTPTNDGGHKIIKLSLWDKIIEYIVDKINFSQKNIIQFARGNMHPELYNYKSALKEIYSKCPEYIAKKSVIVHLISSLNIEKKRNINRKRQGGHFVSEHVLETIYNNTNLSYLSDDGNYYINLNKYKIPVFRIINTKQFSKKKLEVFLMQEINRLYYEISLTSILSNLD